MQCSNEHKFLHMWQSRVEIEHYSVAYFERGNTVELHNRIMFDFYPGLPHMMLKYGAQIQALISLKSWPTLNSSVVQKKPHNV